MTKRKGRETKIRGIKDMGGGEYLIRALGRDPRTGKRLERERRVKARSIQEALRLKLELEKELGAPPEQTAPSLFGEAAEAWLRELTERRHPEDPSQPFLLPSTRDKYQGSIKRALVPFFGEFLIAKISRQDVEAWRRVLVEAGYSHAYVNTHARTLKQILKASGNTCMEGLRELNEQVTARITRQEPNLLTLAELDRFLEVARERYPQHFALILTLATTSLRIGAVLALRREDIDLESMEIVARRRLSKGEVHPGVKRDRFGEDAPPLLQELRQALQAHWARFNELQTASGLCFPGRTGQHHTREVLKKPFHEILKEAGIKKRLTPHGLRRTAAKLLRTEAGAEVSKAIAGHTTDRMHDHYTPISGREKMEGARRAFAGLRSLSGKSGDRGGDRE